MIRAHAKFKFNKAAQGCFYSGTIEIEEKPFTMVYDCGTKSTGAYLKGEIKQFKDKLKDTGNILNLLVISHFDQDHVNQVATLLRGITSIDRVVLPYLTPEERMYLYFSSRSAEDGEDEPAAGYGAFMIDPVAFLNRFKVKEIIFIGNGGNNDGSNGNEDIDPHGPINWAEGKKRESESNGYTIDDSNIKINRLLPAAEYAVQLSRSKGKSEVGFYSGGKIFIDRIWEFIFYSEPAKAGHMTKVLAFKKAVYDKLASYKRAGMSKSVTIKTIFERYTEFADLYRTHFMDKDLNFSSVIVYHIPRVNVDIWWEDDWSRLYKPERSATLLMGDASLKGLSLPSEINLSLVRICQIPHHGAETNWKSTIFRKLNDTTVVVFNFGLGNPHKHPRPKIVDIIANRYRLQTRINTQLQSFSYGIHSV
ncbi:MAG: hypothetical protein EOO20_02285 [Chryseobacterium sp.]|nr:MAG: hypothetical protein EOO20_02285 [Chryseobacterium sp.]